jgi:hypothetical protein
MENTQTKAKAIKSFIKPISFYNKYNCETCKYHTNFKNSFNKHTKSAKHLSLNPPLIEEKEFDQTEVHMNTVEEKQQVDGEISNEELHSEVVMDASMGFITVEEIEKDTVNKDSFSYNEYQLTKIVDLMESLNTSFKKDLRIKYFYTGMGFFLNFILFNLCLFHFFIRSQRSDIFELSG